MAYNIEYTVSMDATAAIAMLEEKGAAIAGVLDDWLVSSAELVRDTEKDKVSKGVSGALKDSIGITYDMPGHAAVIAPTSKYAPYVEYGTGPHMPPVDAITPWAEMHGLNPWAVAMGIKKHGTAAHPFVKPTLDEVSPVILANADAAIAKAMEA